MKDQYFGDENDFRKYGLLRTLTRKSGLSLAVCWMLTPPDGRTDGRFTRYLTHSPEWEVLDPPLYRFLRETVVGEGVRRVSALEDSELLPAARFYSAVVPDSRHERLAWRESALAAASGADLVFFDPDNGLLVRSKREGSRGSSKFLLWSEAREFYARGHSLLIYQHFPRRPRPQFIAELGSRLCLETRAASVVAFSTTRLVFVLLPQAAHAHTLQAAARAVAANWQGQIAVSEVGSGPSPGLSPDRAAGPRQL